MSAKVLIFATFAVLLSLGSCGVVPVAYSAAYVAPYASSYHAQVVNHAVAVPAAAPLVAAPAAAPLVAAPAAAVVSPYTAAAIPAAYSPYTAALLGK